MQVGFSTKIYTTKYNRKDSFFTLDIVKSHYMITITLFVTMAEKNKKKKKKFASSISFFCICCEIFSALGSKVEICIQRQQK